MAKSAILDTSALNALYLLKQLSTISLLYESVLIPPIVEREFISTKNETENDIRFRFLIEFYEANKIWFSKCLTADIASQSIIVDMFKSENKNLDAGEVEALAQASSLGIKSYHVILDESIARDFAKKKSFCVHGTLFLIAMLDIQMKALDYKQSVSVLKQNGFHIKKDVIDKVYREVKSEIL